MGDSDDITQLLKASRNGNKDALAHLIPMIYEELRELARIQRRKGAHDTLNTTAIVHEAYEKLFRSKSDFADRRHFFRVAARAMREVVIDSIRKHSRIKRGGGVRPLELNEDLIVTPDQSQNLLSLDEALSRLATLNGRQAEVVELRYFVGLTIPETAEVMETSPATVKRDWLAARAWLHRELADAA